MALVPDQKFSTFIDGGDLQVDDIIVGLRNGLNTQFNYTGELPIGVVVPIANGGTGATTAAGARTNLGLGTMAVQNANAVAITGGTATLGQLTVDNIRLDGNTISTLASSLALAPFNGTMTLGNMSFNTDTITITNADGNLFFEPNGIGHVQIDLDRSAIQAGFTIRNVNTGAAAESSILLISAATSNAPTRIFYKSNDSNSLQWVTGNDIATLSNSFYIGYGSSPATTGLAMSINSSLNATFVGQVNVPLVPTATTSATSKSYVDSVAIGLNIQPAVKCATTTARTVTYNNAASGVGATLTNAGALAAFSADGISPTAGQRVLVKNQASQLQNGIYTVTTVGSGAVAWVLTRATDFDEPSEIQPGDLVVVTQGTTQAGSSWMQTNTVTAVGSDAIAFTQFTASIPVEVANGGTGRTSATAYALIAGGTTSTGAMQSLSAGTANQILQSNGAAALPSYTATPSLTSITVGGGTAWGNYLEGTWTPTLTSSSPGTLAPGYTTQYGTYTRNGNMMTITWNLVCTPTLGTASGLLRIGGIPVICSQQAYGGSVNNGANVAYPAGTTSLNCQVQASAITILFLGIGTSISATSLNINTALTTGVATTISGQVTYYV